VRYPKVLNNSSVKCVILKFLTTVL